MDRFVSNTINKLDKKGRVSIPANFRANLKGQSEIYLILGIDHPVVDAGGAEFMASNLQRLDQMDPFSEEYEHWSFHLLGDAQEVKIDGEGRMILTDHIREHTGITNEVAFVGRGHFFQLWAPERFNEYREKTRLSVKKMRKKLSNSPASGRRKAGEQGV